MKNIKKFLPIAVALLSTLPLVGLATTFPLPSTISSIPTPPVSNTQNLEGLATVSLRWIFWGLIVVSVALFLIGGYRYATSSGDPERVHNANRTLIFAAVAMAVALVAAGMRFVIGSLLGASPPTLNF